MKNNITFLLIITIFSCGLFSCSSTKPDQTAESEVQSEKTVEEVPAVTVTDVNVTAADVNEPAPKIVFEDKLLEFGKIGPETKASGEFKFSNEGNAVLEIGKISQCCGVVITCEKKIYKPGEKGVINVTYKASQYVGKIAKEYVVYSNDPVNPGVVLLITGEVVNKVVVNPRSLKLFLDEDNAGCPKLTVKSVDGQAFAVRGIQSTGNCITAEFDKDYKATEIELDLKADIEKLRQNKTGYVDIIVTHPDMSMVNFSFDVLSRFAITPPKITELNVNPGVPIPRTIYVFNKYNQEFEIDSISSENGNIEILDYKKEENRFQIDIKIVPPPADDKISFSDVLYIQVKNHERLELTCNGYYDIP